MLLLQSLLSLKKINKNSWFIYSKSKGPIIFREHQRNSKDYYVKSLDATTIYNSNDEPEIILATASDITHRWHEQNTLKQRAQRDSLTHLYNLEAGKYIVNEYIKHHPGQKML